MKIVVTLLTILALACAPGIASAAAIVFDTVPNGAGGTVTYDGVGGPAIGTGIAFVDIVGVGTPQNSGLLLSCVDCLLNFVTGPNISEGPTYQWAGGGSFSITGDVPFLGLDDVVLLSGTFIGTPNTPGLAAGDLGGFFIGAGSDTKNDFLTGFYGLPGTGWTFANTEIMLGTLTVDPVTGAFTGIPNQADIVNVNPVPEPATLLLLGSGLVGAAWFRRRTR
jgi:PEP-CTERM putative exosortase interaction domain